MPAGRQETPRGGEVQRCRPAHDHTYRGQVVPETGKQRPRHVHLRHRRDDGDVMPGDGRQRLGRVEPLDQYAARAVPGDRAEGGVQPERVKQRQRRFVARATIGGCTCSSWSGSRSTRGGSTHLRRARRPGVSRTARSRRRGGRGRRKVGRPRDIADGPTPAPRRHRQCTVGERGRSVRTSATACRTEPVPTSTAAPESASTRPTPRRVAGVHRDGHQAAWSARRRRPRNP
jgi:hypothetical protein